MRWPSWLRHRLGGGAAPSTTAPSPPPCHPRPNPERHALRNKQTVLWGRLQQRAQREGRAWTEELPRARADWEWERQLYGAAPAAEESDDAP